jgi:pimeloyl-ACP methyl ester carboxylesterase
VKTTQSKDGTTIAYDVYGNGPALIFITGATCFRLFEPVLADAQTFAQEFTVYNYDRRGRGDSGNTLPYDPQREIEDIEALIEVAGGTAYLYGHSSGAILALEAALRLGNKVSKLVIYDPPYSSDEAEYNQSKLFNEELFQLLEQGKNAEAIKFFLSGIGMPEEMIEGMAYSPQWETMLALAPTLAYDNTIALDFAPLEQAAKLNTPIQIIVGENSPVSMHEVATQLSQTMPQAKYLLLSGQDHYADAEVVLPILSGFLK